MKKLILLLFILCPKLIFSQWEPTTWNSDESLINLYISENIIIYIKAYGGIAISMDNGNNWKSITDLPKDIVPKTILVKDNNIFLGGLDFLYRSTDFGETWQSKTNGMQSLPIVNSFVKIGNKIFAGTAAGVFISTDNGEIWIEKNNGFGKYLTVFEMINSGNKLFASNQSGIYLSTDYGESWIQKNNGLPKGYTFDKISKIDSLILIGSNVDTYNGGINKIYITTDYGDSWIEKNNQPFYKSYIYSFASIGNRILLSSKDSLFVSYDSAKSWLNITNSLPLQLQQGVEEFFVDNENIYAISGSELYVSSDDGSTWIALRKVNNYGAVYTLAVNGNTIFAGASPIKKMSTYPDGIYSSIDFGNTWEPRGLFNRDVHAIYTYDSNIYAITNSGNFLSTNLGNTWLEKYIGFPDSTEVWSVAFYSNGIVAACGSEGIKFSSDAGILWTVRNNGLPIPNQRAISLKFQDNTLYAGLDSSFYISTDFGETWHEKNKGLPSSDLMIWQIETNGNNLYFVSKSGIYYSSDYGENWSIISNKLPNWDYDNYKDNYNCKIFIVNDNIFAIVNSSNGGVFLSTDNGNTWIPKNNGISNFDFAMSSISILGDYIYVGTNSGRYGERGDGIFKARISYLITNINDDLKVKQNAIDIAPNPINEKSEIIINLEKHSSITTSLINNSGIEVSKMIHNKEFEPGEYKFDFDTSNLSSGIYYLTLKTGQSIISTKIIIIH